jgi:hypothetical protein
MQIQTTEQEREVLLFLNDLRNQGITNMYGAITHIEHKFPVPRDEARRLLVLWMKNFNDAGRYDFIEKVT